MKPGGQLGVRVRSAAPGMRLVLTAVALVTLYGCAPMHGAGFGYPDKPAVPDGANVLVTDKGWDDDDPMRARVKVIDVGNSSAVTLLDFYRANYGSTKGWKQATFDHSHQELCLVRHSDDGYSELVEVFPYRGSRVAEARGRHLVVSSRFESLKSISDENNCSRAVAWIPSDLL